MAVGAGLRPRGTPKTRWRRSGPCKFCAKSIDPNASYYVKVIDGPKAPMPSCRLLEQEHLVGYNLRFQGANSNAEECAHCSRFISVLGNANGVLTHGIG